MVKRALEQENFNDKECVNVKSHEKCLCPSFHLQSQKNDFCPNLLDGAGCNNFDFKVFVFDYKQ